MLLSAGAFANYRSETHVFNSLAPHCGDLRLRANRRRLLDIWVASDMHTRSRLDGTDVLNLVDQFENAGGFLSSVMQRIVESQRAKGVRRWAETTPAHVLHMPEIQQTIPAALFVHVIRDGRDVAVSLERQQWVVPYPWDRERPVAAAAAFWSWMVQHGRALGHSLKDGTYLEVRYEAMVANPTAMLAELSAFVGQELSHEHILAHAVGSVKRPNTSFPGQVQSFSGRWRETLTPPDAQFLNDALAGMLESLEYPIDPVVSPRASTRLAPYLGRFAMRHWIKSHTPLARRADISLFAPRPGAVPPTD